MKACLFFPVFLFAIVATAQKMQADSAELALTDFSDLNAREKLLAAQKEDTLKVLLLGNLAYSYAFSQPEKGVAHGQQGLKLAERLNYKKGSSLCAYGLSWSYWALGNYSAALQLAFDCMLYFEQAKDPQYQAQGYILLANVYRDIGDYKKALPAAYKAKTLQELPGFSPRISCALIGSIFELQNRLDSAYLYISKSLELDRRDNNGEWDWLYILLGNVERKKENYNAALGYYRTALPIAIKTNIYKSIVEALNGIAEVYKETGNEDSCIFYANQVLQKWSTVSYQKGVLQTANILAAAYKQKQQPDSTIKYIEFSAALNSKLFSQEQERDIQNIGFNEQMRLETLKRERQEYRDNLKMYGLLAAVVVVLTIGFMLWRHNQHRKKAYDQLQKQKTETDRQKEKAEKALKDLKAAQLQLIQSEKMASLGELTAGIAHEIQNPVNFINNFSDINSELIDEIKSEVKAGNIAGVLLIADDIQANERKINLHGKRADAIVKGMLQHSRVNPGKTEPTDINALADECLRFSYHGFRVKDKNFTAEYRTSFDGSIGKINIVPQDIGRVLINLFNNAFYAVNEKKMHSHVGFQPLVTATTRLVNDRIEITVTDNGNGIPQDIVNKIFQPFFTTKPTGQGTGLGLSLSYDIIKAHGGELKVETIEGKGSDFSIYLFNV